MPRKKIRISKEGKLLNTTPETKKGPKKGIIYTRVSTTQQKNEGHSLEQQKKDCERRAIKNEVEIIGYYADEGVSGNGSIDRKSFNDALSILKNKNKKNITIDYFICHTTSRFSRNHDLSKTYGYISEVKKTGAEIVIAGTGGVLDMDSEAGMVTNGIQVLFDAIESKRGQSRVNNGIDNRIRNGYRPFAQTPVGYKFETQKDGDKQNKILIQDESKFQVIKKGLEMFASGELSTKQDLYNYYNLHHLRSNSKSNTKDKLHLSIIDRILDPRKLYIYAGYITYPDRGFNDLIPAKHIAMIRLDEVEKILIRLGKYKNLTNMKTSNKNLNDELFPLRGVLFCPECEKKCTGRASKSGTGELHYYYGCNNKHCKIYKKSLKKDQLHEEMKQLIKHITPPEKILILIEKIFDTIRNEKKYLQKDILRKRKQEIKKIEEKLQQIQNKMLVIENTQLLKAMDNDRTNLNEEKNQIEEQLSYDPLGNIERVNLLNDIKSIILNPLLLRDIGDHNMKKLLIQILFNGKVYYKKNQGYQTPDLSALYKAFKAIKHNDLSNGGP